MTILPIELWAELDNSLGQIDLRLSPERAVARLHQLLAAQPPGTASRMTLISVAAIALVGAHACELRTLTPTASVGAPSDDSALLAGLEPR